MPTRHLDKLLDPGSIVLIGASAREGSPGLALTTNLVEGGYRGTLQLVNPRYDEVLGLTCHRSMAQIDGVPDLALVLIPQRLLRRTLVACARRGVKLALILSGTDRPEALHAYARRLGMRLLGPWCAGLLRPHLGLNATFAATRVEPGSVAVVSQSATLAAALIDWAETAGVGFSAMLSTGADTDVRLTDILDVLAGDHRTRAIIVYLDRVRSSRTFLSALAAAARSKPVVLMRSTHDGAPHCDALTRSTQVYSSNGAFQAALSRSGVVRIRTFSNLFSSARILDSRLRTKGRRLAVLGNGAAPAMLACESLATRGFVSPQLDADTLRRLGEALDPDTSLADGLRARLQPQRHSSRQDRRDWTGRNPIVLRDAARLVEHYRAAIDVLARADGFDALLVIFVPDARNDPRTVARALIEALPLKRPLLACWMGEASVREARDDLAEAGIPSFRTPEAATAGVDFLYRYHVSQQQLLQLPEPGARDTRADVDTARSRVRRALDEGQRLLGPQATRELLALFDIEVMPAVRAETEAEALAAAARIGYPVACKLVSPNLAWKASVVPTALGIADDAALGQAFRNARDTLARDRPEAHFRGVLIERMHVPGDARELKLGIHTDATFGPVLSLGIGGDLTALVHERQVQLPPLNRFLIDQLLDDATLSNYLGAFRHKPAVDPEPLRQVLMRLSEMACELPEIFALDINPLILSPGRAVAIDVQIVLEKARPGVRYGHLAIHPYPWQWVREDTLRDGQAMTLRPIRPEDASALQDMVRSLSAESRYLRFMHAVNDLSPLLLAQFTKLDYDRAMAFVADPGNAKLAGVAQYSLDRDGTGGEFAITVADHWQGHGLATRLMGLLIEHAREHGLTRLWGDVLRNNKPMHGLMKRLGFTGRASTEDRELQVFTLLLDEPGSVVLDVASDAGTDDASRTRPDASI